MRGNFSLGRTNQGNSAPVRWESLPEDTKKEFLRGSSFFTDMYLDDSVHTPAVYKRELIDEFIVQIISGKHGYYGWTDLFLYESFKEFPIKGKEVAIIGSVTPWYEAVILAYGGFPTTIEYNKIETDDPRLTLMTVEEFNKKPKKFPFVLSISSFEHDGLGRYGDPIDPDGDLKAMKNVRENILEKDGILFLSVPMGKDRLVFNSHRKYGKGRMRRLIEGYSMQRIIPDNKEKATQILLAELESGGKGMDTPYGDFQPVTVLKNK